MDSVSGSAIREINELNKKAHSYDWQSDKMGGGMILGQDGAILHTASAYETNHADTVEGFCDMALNQWSRYSSPSDAIITISRGKLIFKVDPTEKICHSPQCDLKLSYTKQLTELFVMDAEDGRHFAQRDLNSWLRKNFPDSQMNTECMPTMRQIKFSTSAESSHSVDHGSDEMSNTAKRQAMGANGSGIPEFGTLNLQVWKDVPDIVVSVRCAIDVNLDEREIEICPVAGEMDRAINEAVEALYNSVKMRIGTSEIAIIMDASLDQTRAI